MSQRSHARVLAILALASFASAACATSASNRGANGVSQDASHNALSQSSTDATLDELSDGWSPAIRRDLQLLRAATAPFHDLLSAQQAGYPTDTPACIADSTMGGMGRHYFDRAAYDDTLKIEHPEMLLYAPSKDGTYTLVAVEYVIPFKLRPPTSTPPRLFGQELKRHDEFKYWYLHVWAWSRNPAGLFADWNPLVHCPS